MTLLSRRGLLAGGSGLLVGAAATEGANLAAGGTSASKQLTPGEDLMREHGVLQRVLLAYRHVLARMYEPREAREDTVVFPALRQLLTAGRLRALAETLVAEENRQFGPDAFPGMVDRVAGTEQTLGIGDLSQFSPTA